MIDFITTMWLPLALAVLIAGVGGAIVAILHHREDES